MIAGTLVLAPVSGFMRQWLTPGEAISALDVAFTFTGAFLIFLWYRADTNARGYRRTALLNVGVVALAVVALPYYFFRSRGAKGGLLATLAFFAVFIAFLILQSVGEYAAYALLPATRPA
jgi:amino acid transporter